VYKVLVMLSVPLFEPVFGDNRKTVFPIARKNVFNAYDVALKCQWTPKEITLAQDKIDFATKLDAGRRRLVTHTHAFFASSDGLVNDNITQRFAKEVLMQDAQYFYNFQTSTEDIHAYTYSVILDAIVPSEEERNRLINAAHSMPVIKQMTDYITECTNSDAPFSERLLRMACVEGIFFTGCFCAIYWLTDQGLMPGLGHANELISRDEWLHTQFALLLYSMLNNEHKLSRARIYEIFAEAVVIASDFTADALPEDLPEMNAGDMKKYIQSQADNVLALLGMEPLYNIKCPFEFMDRQNMANRVNFFDRRVSDYAQAVTPDDGTTALEF